jgi:Ca-activated chloride channel family protein
VTMLPMLTMLPLLLQSDALESAGADAIKSVAEGRVHLWGDLFLADPGFLILIPLALLVLMYGRSRKARGAARFSVLLEEELPVSLGQSLSWLPVLMQFLALSSLVIAMARPLRGNVETNTVSEGVDLALLIDRSSSMQHMDLEANSTRLEVVKEVVAEFATRRMTDREGASDYVALFSFARYPEELCPFTLDVDAVQGFLKDVQLAKDRAEDGTGIGIALAKAVAVLRESEAKSKVVVLLTDGENNLDLISPAEAARLAAEEGVRVYTVFAGSYVIDGFGRARRIDLRYDALDLQEIADVTGGRFFTAADRRELEKVYEEIENLERTPREEQRFVEHFDLYRAFLLVALGLYASAWFSLATWARRLP